MALAKGSPFLRFGWVAGLVVLDQWSKSAVFRLIGVGTPGGPRTEPLLGDWLSFAYSCNPGAAFGQFDQFPWLLVMGRIAAVLFLGWLLLRADSRPRLVLAAMTLVLAGALGNLIDNLGAGCATPDHAFEGVRDFVLVWFGPLGWDEHFPAFNVADACITVGACAWILAGFVHKPAPEPVPDARAARS